MKLWGLTLTLLCSFQLNATHFSQSCKEWNTITRNIKNLTLSERFNNRTEQILQSAWMKQKGIKSSRLYVCSEKEQNNSYACWAAFSSLYKGHKVCTPQGVQTAHDYATEQKDEGYYARVASWDEPWENIFRKELDYPSGLLGATQGIEGKVEGAANDYFYTLWSSYEKVRKFSDMYNPNCHVKDRPCIRRAHARATSAFEKLVQGLPEPIHMSFLAKAKILDQQRELDWQSEDLTPK